MRARDLAWALWLATASLVVGTIVLGLTNGSVSPRFDAPFMVISLTFATSAAVT